MSGRKVLVASYCAEEHFIIPKGLDLDDETVVEGYGVKWGTLYIDFVDGREMQIKAKFSVNDNDFKRPDDTEIRDVDDYGYGEEDFDDEEQEEEKKEEMCECCDNVATETFEDVPCCTDCHKNGVEYYKSMGI